MDRNLFDPVDPYVSHLASMKNPDFDWRKGSRFVNRGLFSLGVLQFIFFMAPPLLFPYLSIYDSIGLSAWIVINGFSIGVLALIIGLIPILRQHLWIRNKRKTDLDCKLVIALEHKFKFETIDYESKNIAARVLDINGVIKLYRDAYNKNPLLTDWSTPARQLYETLGTLEYYSKAIDNDVMKDLPTPVNDLIVKILAGLETNIVNLTKAELEATKTARELTEKLTSESLESIDDKHLLKLNRVKAEQELLSDAVSVAEPAFEFQPGGQLN